MSERKAKANTLRTANYARHEKSSFDLTCKIQTCGAKGTAKANSVSLYRVFQSTFIACSRRMTDLLQV